MPREAITFGQFKGIYPNADARDLPEGYSPWAQNLDYRAGSTRLVGRLGDTASAQIFYPPTRYAWLVRQDGKYDLVYWTKWLGEIRIVKDFDGTRGDEFLFDTGTASSVSLTPYGNWIIVGIDGAKSKIVGYFTHDGMNAPGPNELAIVDFDTNLINSFPFLSKVCTDETYFLGAAYNGDVLYRITIADNVVAYDSTDFKNIKSVCLADSGYIWVLDYPVTGLYRISHVDIANGSGDLEIDFSKYLTLPANPADANTPIELTDIERTEDTTDYLWFHGFSDSELYGKMSMVMRVAEPVSGTSSPVTITNVTPKFTGTGSAFTIGAFSNSNSSVEFVSDYLTSTGYMQVGQRINHPLFPMAADKMGWMFVFEPNDNFVYYYDSGSAPRFLRGLFCNCITTSDTTATQSKLMGLWTNIAGAYSLLWENPDYREIGAAYESGATNLCVSLNTSPSIRYLLRVNAPTIPTSAGELRDVTYTAISANVTNGERICQAVTGSTTFYMTHTVLTVGVSTIDSGFAGTTAPAVSIENDLWTLAVVKAVGSGLAESTKYFYAFSLVFEDLHESQLSAATSATTDNSGGTDWQMSVTLTFKDYPTLGERISAINIYRGSNSDTSAAEPSGYYRLLKTVRFSESDAYVTVTAEEFEIQLTDSVEEAVTVSYEASTGLSEALSAGSVQFGVSAFVGQEFFIGNVLHSAIPDAAYLILKSKNGRPCMFNWTSDIMRVDFVPTALVPFGPRLLIFGKDKFLLVNTQGMFIEDELEGFGMAHDAAWTLTDKGLIFLDGDRKRILLYDGKSVTNVGFPIEQLRGTVGYSLASQVSSAWGGNAPLCLPVYVAKLGAVFFAVHHSASSLHRIGTFVLSFENGPRWDYWKLDINDSLATTEGLFHSLIGTPNGDLFMAYMYGGDDSPLVYEIGNNATRKRFVWYSPLLAFGSTLKKRFYKIYTKYQGTGTATLYTSFDEASFSSLNIAPANQTTWTYFRVMQFYYTSSSTATEAVEEFVVWIRRLIGLHV